jgi:membrane-associated phospholipid phosphatase
VLKGWTRVTITSIVLLATAHRATAQQPILVDSMALGSRMKARDESGSLRALPHIGTAVLATIVLLPLDRPIQKLLQRSSLQHQAGLHHAAESIAYAGAQGPFLAGSVFFVVGRAAGSERWADLGLHLTEAAALAAGLTALGKGIAGRALPDVPSSSPDDFSLGRGFHTKTGDFVSFPAGHAATAFASAAVLTSEVSRWRPDLEGIVGPIAYGGATLVALGRMYQNRHWASDNPLSIVIGTWSGLTVVRRQHSGTRSRLDQWLLGVSAVPVGSRAVAVGWSSTSGSAPESAPARRER